MKRRVAFTASMPELIAHKRNGGALSNDQIQWLVQGYTHGDIPDYQMSAFAMAVFFRGMSDDETTALTLAMRDSGRVVSLDSVPGRCIDKHSTGGVGDKISICLAPLVAACGVIVPMVSGRGLGHTGGTLDKLESIPGFRIDLSPTRFVSQLKQIGCALIGQTKDIAPADKRLYALRDVTGTVESIPLITSSILSKKLAAGIDGLVLDVKVGSGAFMKSLADAKALAASLVRIGRLANKQVSALITDMETPLGLAIGNAMETTEAFTVLHGSGPEDVRECTMALGAEMLRLGGITRSPSKARKLLQQAIASGNGIKRMQQIVKRQGGDPRVVEEPDRLPQARHRIALAAPKTGYVTRLDAEEVGRCAVLLGAGRSRAEDAIDPAVGLMLHAKPGDAVQQGQALLTIHSSTTQVPAVADRLLNAYSVGRRPPRPRPLIHHTIRG